MNNPELPALAANWRFLTFRLPREDYLRLDDEQYRLGFPYHGSANTCVQ